MVIFVRKDKQLRYGSNMPIDDTSHAARLWKGANPTPLNGALVNFAQNSV